MIAPEIPPSLSDYLDAAFPNVLPTSLPVDQQQVAALIGQQQVVEHLRSLIRGQEEDSTHAFLEDS